MTVRVGDIVAHTRKRGWLKAEERFAGVVSRVSSGGHRADVDRPCGAGTLVIRGTFAVSSLHAPTADEEASIRAWQERMSEPIAADPAPKEAVVTPGPPSSIDWERVYVDLWIATAGRFTYASAAQHAEHVNSSFRLLRQNAEAAR
jgi:hypothetical protein